jgi:hypothetical protein
MSMNAIRDDRSEVLPRGEKTMKLIKSAFAFALAALPCAITACAAQTGGSGEPGEISQVEQLAAPQLPYGSSCHVDGEDGVTNGTMDLLGRCCAETKGYCSPDPINCPSGKPIKCVSCTFYVCEAGPSASFDGDYQVWLEGESGTLTPPMQKIVNANASVGLGVGVPGGSTTSGASVTYSFDTEAATLFPWVRVVAPSTAANSFAIQIDKGPIIAFDVPVTGSAWSWSQVQRATDGGRTSFALTAGTHVLRVYATDPGSQLDRLLLTKNAAFVPVVSKIEAETAPRVSPMTTGTTTAIPMVGYAWIPTGDHRTGGLLSTEALVTSTGNYTVWGRVNAPSTAHNSFLVSNDFGAKTAWDTPVTSSTGWAWGQVKAVGATTPALFSMHSTSFVEFDGAEDGTKLDTILITNDPGFLPKDPSTTTSP